LIAVAAIALMLSILNSFGAWHVFRM